MANKRLHELLKIVEGKDRGSRIVELLRIIKRREMVKEWRELWYNQILVPQKGIDNQRYKGYKWILGKEIRIFRTPEVNKQVIPYVQKGIEDLIGEIGLDISVINYDTHITGIEQSKQALTNDGKIDDDKLFEILIAEKWRNPKYGGKPHADVMVLGRLFAEAAQNWGFSHFEYGSMILALPKERQQSLKFIRNISKHETGHLLGFTYHHDENDKIYEPVNNCNMRWEASTLFTCDKCKDAITYFWKKLEYKYGQNFFKS